MGMKFWKMSHSIYMGETRLQRFSRYILLTIYVVYSNGLMILLYGVG